MHDFMLLLLLPLLLLPSRTIAPPTTASKLPNCSLYLRQSRLGAGAGMGVFAGEMFDPHQSVLEVAPAIAVPNSATNACVLRNYAYGFNDTHEAVYLGLGAMYNHHTEHRYLENHYHMPQQQQQQQQHRSGPAVGCYDSDALICSVAITNTGPPIARGEEIYSYYGDNWFEEHGVNSAALDVDASTTGAAGADGLDHAAVVQIVPGCAGSDVRVSDWKAFATRDYLAGAIVEVSKGLVLPRAGYAGTDLAAFVLPLVTTQEEPGERALLLLGKGALYFLARPVEQDSQGGLDPLEIGSRVFFSDKTGTVANAVTNLQVAWWSLSNADTQHKLHSPEPHQSSVWVAFTASRRIRRGALLGLHKTTYEVCGSS